MHFRGISRPGKLSPLSTRPLKEAPFSALDVIDKRFRFTYFSSLLQDLSFHLCTTQFLAAPESKQAKESVYLIFFVVKSLRSS